MRRHRTTARGALFLTLLAALGAAGAATRAGGAASPIVFPIVGTFSYTDNYGDPRPNGSHAATDIMTTWRSAAVAAEGGTVKFWTTSARAGCMLYLYGASGTTYLYVHLNNDLTRRRDNSGKCVPGVAYAEGLRDGAKVKAGQLLAYNGDSGDAEGTYHLHFEVHPNDGADVNPYPFLEAATRTLFPTPPQKSRRLVLGLRGTPVSAGAGVLELAVTAVRVWPGVRWMAIAPRTIELTVPEAATVDPRVAEQILAPTRRTLASRTGSSLTVFTTPVPPSEAVVRGDPRTLVVDRVQVPGPGGPAAVKPAGGP